jgi:hypothetical protein
VCLNKFLDWRKAQDGQPPTRPIIVFEDEHARLMPAGSVAPELHH